jgi:PPOX class probable FMN-dependent enzyme
MGPISPLAEGKVLQQLDVFCRDFISLSPFLILASSDGRDGVDASPRGDAPGFVRVLDDTTLLIPDRRGNNRVDTFDNVLKSPGVGLIFLVPGIGETLRVNGVADIVTDADILEPMAVQNAVPKLGLRIRVREVYFHCAKAIIRSKLWADDYKVERDVFPSLGRILAAQTNIGSAEETSAAIAEAYRSRLY